MERQPSLRRVNSMKVKNNSYVLHLAQRYVDDYSSLNEQEIKIIEMSVKKHKEVVMTIQKQSIPMEKKFQDLKLSKQILGMVQGADMAMQTDKNKHQARCKTCGIQSRKWAKKFGREFKNIVSAMVPWNGKIKQIESRFGGVTAAFFTFLRWVCWLNLILGTLVGCLIMVPEVVVGPKNSTRKRIPESQSTFTFGNVWSFDGIVEYSILFYGYYGDDKKTIYGDEFKYNMPLAYFLVNVVVLGLSLFLVTRKMGHNSRETRYSWKNEHYIFCWKVWSCWDYTIAHIEGAQNKHAAIETHFKEIISEAKSKEKKYSNVTLFFLRLIANILCLAVISGSGAGIYKLTDRYKEVLITKYSPTGNPVKPSLWSEIELTVVMSLVVALFPNIFELISQFEFHHPKIALRMLFFRILTLYIINLYTFIYSLYIQVNELEKLNNKTMPSLTTTALPCAVVGNLVGKSSPNATTIAEDLLGINTTSIPNITTTLSATVYSSTPDNPIVPTVTLNGTFNRLCWENDVGREFYKLLVIDMITTIVSILVIDFFRSLFVRYMNNCWCWDLENTFPEYGEFKVAENILHVIYNQFVVWSGTLLCPGLPLLNIIKLILLFYIRAWACMTCNVPSNIFSASGSTNFYYGALLGFLMLAFLPVGYAISWSKTSNICGPFSTNFTYITDVMNPDETIKPILAIISSPTAIIPIFAVLLLVLYYNLMSKAFVKTTLKELNLKLDFERDESQRKLTLIRANMDKWNADNVDYNKLVEIKNTNTAKKKTTFAGEHYTSLQVTDEALEKGVGPSDQGITPSASRVTEFSVVTMEPDDDTILECESDEKTKLTAKMRSSPLPKIRDEKNDASAERIELRENLLPKADNDRSDNQFL